MGRVLNFGHRGASHDRPENTLAAFELAAQYGADGVELDVVLTKDRRLAVIHDEYVDSTTDGTGPVAAKTLAEMKELDAGSHFSADYAGLRVPTLDEVFEAVGDRLLINIELKGLGRKNDGLEAVVADLVAHHKMAERVLISSFNPLRLRRMRRIAPQLPLGFLHDHSAPLSLRLMAQVALLGLQTQADHPHESEITSKYLIRARRRKQRVNVWTVNDPERMRELVSLGIDTIMTDRPDVLRAVLHGEL